jgi:hypothetical protein
VSDEDDCRAAREGISRRRRVGQSLINELRGAGNRIAQSMSTSKQY